MLVMARIRQHLQATCYRATVTRKERDEEEEMK